LIENDVYDVIVIGSGVGGSACAAILSQAGFKTLILEKNNEIGGACSSYFKEGFIIDRACHIIPIGIKGVIGKILKKCGLKNLVFSKKIGTDSAVRLLNSDYIPLSFAPNDLISLDQFKGLFDAFGFSPEEQTELINVVFKILQYPRSKIRQMFETKIILSEFLDKLTNSERVKFFLSWFNGLMFVIPPTQTSAAEFLHSFQEMVFKNDVSYPMGGCIAIPQAFIEGVKKFGGIYKPNIEVKKILIEDNKVIGVELNNGNIINSKIVISNLNIKQTVNKLVGPKYFDKQYLEKVNSLKGSGSTIVLKIAVDKVIIPNYSSVHLIHTDNFSKIIESYKDWEKMEAEERIPDNPVFMVPIPSNIDKSLAPPGKQLLIFGSGGIATSEKRNWDPWIERYYEAILDFHPEIDDHLIFMDITTPSPNTGKIKASTDLTSYRGNFMVEGTSLTPDQAGKYRISSQLPIEGLFVVGDSAGTDTHGVGTQIAADSGLKCAQYITSKYKMKTH